MHDACEPPEFEIGGRTGPRAAQRDVGESAGHHAAVEPQRVEHVSELVAVHPQVELGAILGAFERPASGGLGPEGVGLHVEPFELHSRSGRRRREGDATEVQLAEDEAPGRKRHRRQCARIEAAPIPRGHRGFGIEHEAREVGDDGSVVRVER